MLRLHYGLVAECFPSVPSVRLLARMDAALQRHLDASADQQLKWCCHLFAGLALKLSRAIRSGADLVVRRICQRQPLARPRLATRLGTGGLGGWQYARAPAATYRAPMTEAGLVGFFALASRVLSLLANSSRHCFWRLVSSATGYWRFCIQTSVLRRCPSFPRALSIFCSTRQPWEGR